MFVTGKKFTIVMAFSLIQAVTVGLLYAYVTSLLLQRFGMNRWISLLCIVLGGRIVTLAILAFSRTVYTDNNVRVL